MVKPLNEEKSLKNNYKKCAKIAPKSTFAPFSIFVVPFVRLQSILDYFCERVNKVSTQVWVDVFGEKLASLGPVLGPVCVIANVHFSFGYRLLF
jgi:hypothetical protein